MLSKKIIKKKRENKPIGKKKYRSVYKNGVECSVQRLCLLQKVTVNSQVMQEGNCRPSNTRKKDTLRGLFLPAFGRCPSVSACPASHREMSILYYTLLYHIACTARHGQIVCTQGQIELNILWKNTILPCSACRSVLLPRFATLLYRIPHYYSTAHFPKIWFVE